MMAVTPACAAIWMPSGNGKYASEAMTESGARSPALRSATSTLTTRDGWPAPMPTMACFLASTTAFDFDVPHRAPGEQQVGELLERRPALGDGLELVAVLLHLVEGLDQEPAADALEVELADAQVVRVVLGRRHLDDLEAALRAQDLERLRRVARRHDRLEEARAGWRGPSARRPCG